MIRHYVHVGLSRVLPLFLCLLPSSLFAVEQPPPAARPAPPLIIPAPPQDQGLPYTRSARPTALANIKGEIAVFAGSRYAYVQGYKVRLDEFELRGGEAEMKEGKILVPASFAGVLDLDKVSPPPAPDYLADKWVYTLGLPHKDGAPVDLAALAMAKGLNVYQDASGLLLIGSKVIGFRPDESVLKESVITLFDTPEKFADPDIATKYIPTLAQQGRMTDHIKVTPEQWALLNGPVTPWPTAPKSSYDFTGFNAKLLGSGVPPPGVYPRLLFSPEDVPMLAQRVKSSKLGQMSLIEMDYLFKKSWWDPNTSDGRIFDKLASGDSTGLELDAPPDASPMAYGHMFKGQKAGIFSSHIAYIPECLTAMALYCLLTNDDEHGRKAAAAISTYYKVREPLLDEINAISDSEFGSSLKRADGTIVPMNGNGSTTHWRTVQGVIAHMNLGLSLDFSGKWMTAGEKDTMRRVIAKACYGRRSYGQDAPVRFRDVNWVGWDLPQFIANQEIEGLEGFDPEVAESGVETVRSFCDWGIDENGVVYESNGKTPGSFQFITISMIASARRGENFFGHPHWRKLLTGQIQMTSPNGVVTVNSGTQYVPYSRQPLSFQFTDELKAFFPQDRRPDYLLERAKLYGGLKDEGMREWMIDDFNPAAFKKTVATLPRLRLPSLTYPGFVHGVLYDTDFEPTTRADLDLPISFSDPVHGVFSSYSDRSTNAAWINLLVRPDHYLGAGHHHADAGMFHFSALGVDWFTQSSLSGQFSGKYYNLVQVDGHSEPESIPGVSLGWNAAAKYLGTTLNSYATAGTADLTYAYSYTWMTQPQARWDASNANMGWELDPSPDILKIFAGTARYKIREWWANSNFSNFIATSRAPFNPMQYVFRTAGLVRGKHPYGFIVDDVKKDTVSHLYQWIGMLNGGVWKADVSGLPANMTALAYTPEDPTAKPDLSLNKPALVPQPGNPLLLVCVLNLANSDQPSPPLFKVETLSSPPDKKGATTPYDQLSINTQGTSGNFRVLLLPYRQGEPIPQVVYDAASQTASVDWPGQKDQFLFTSDDTHRTHVTIRRGDENLVVSK
jgi:hypothetical protein